jgi:hypothetical protein
MQSTRALSLRRAGLSLPRSWLRPHAHPTNFNDTTAFPVDAGATGPIDGRR